jgi:hypothetical protein
LPFTEPDELPRRYGREELLARIYRDGERRRRRRTVAALGGGAALASVLAVTVLVARLPGGEPQQVATRGSSSPSTPGSLATTTTAPATEGPTTSAAAPVPSSALRSGGLGPSTTLRPIASTTIPVTTIPHPEPEPEPEPTPTSAVSTCRNSVDPACGTFRWDPDAGPNAPLTIEVTPVVRPGDPRTVDFQVLYTDADAKIDDGCRVVDFGDGTSESVGTVSGCPIAACVAQYGPWTPPAREPGRSEAAVSHTFPGPGTYGVRFTARSGGPGCGQPYASNGDRTVVVMIQ